MKQIFSIGSLSRVVAVIIIICFTATCSYAQLRFSQFPFSSVMDTGSYCVGVQNTSGVFANKRYRLPIPTLNSVLAADNTSNNSLHIHTGTNDLYIDNSYSGFAVKYGTTVMAGLKSYYGITGYLELSTGTHAVILTPDGSTLSANRTLYFPDADGVLATSSQLPVLRIKTLNGDGTHDTLSFTAPFSGTIVQCQSTNNNAQVKFSSMTGTTVMVKFTSAPASGTDNVSLSYWFQ